MAGNFPDSPAKLVTCHLIRGKRPMAVVVGGGRPHTCAVPSQCIPLEGTCSSPWSGLPAKWRGRALPTALWLALNSPSRSHHACLSSYALTCPSLMVRFENWGSVDMKVQTTRKQSGQLRCTDCARSMGVKPNLCFF